MRIAGHFSRGQAREMMNTTSQQNDKITTGTAP